MKFDLNCDLGEGEPPARTAALMRLIGSANVACGGHAGTIASMRLCVDLAIRNGVKLGAHPGLAGPAGFGRSKAVIEPDALENLIREQVGRLHECATRQGAHLHHVKLHGTLYHLTDSDPQLAQRYAQTIAAQWPGLKLFARAGGPMAAAARLAGVEVWPEAFLDRGYADDGTLIPRTAPNALLGSARAVVTRLVELQRHGTILSASGRKLFLHPKTLCIHSDTPGATRLARAVATVLAHAAE